MRGEETKAVRVLMKINIEGKRGRGKPKKRWLDMIEDDMRAISVSIGDVENRDEWKFRTMIADPK
jgi:hypothetical protein